MMREYVKLVRKWGSNVPVCIDSSDNNVLIAGLKEWYDISEDRRQKAEDRLALPSFGFAQDRPVGRAPLINSIKIYTKDEMLPLKSNFDFAFIGLLMSEDKPAGPGGSHSVDELYSLAQQIFDAAVSEYGFKPNQIYFDTTVFPLAIDMPMTPGVPGYTYRTFETIKKIKSDPKMSGAHCVLGVSNCARDLPGRKVGVCRAYVAKAMESGLDAVIANVEHHYGSIEPAPELLELVDAYAKMDGSTEGTNKAMELMSKFCQENRKQAK
jgi:5-methyltetrahydrofolate corrinoid/iron sulfur protein methyltransferase